MNLRETAEADLAIVLEDDAGGFGWPIKVTGPDDNVGNLIGSAGDIGRLIDADTGTAISGRFAGFTLRISSLTAEGLGLPVGIADASKKPWLIEFDDINGNTHKFKVQESAPDRTLGIVTCILELYK
jgi:hypothetical protein